LPQIDLPQADKLVSGLPQPDLPQQDHIAGIVLFSQVCLDQHHSKQQHWQKIPPTSKSINQWQSDVSYANITPIEELC
jgi:hypothetical protein